MLYLDEVINDVADRIVADGVFLGHDSYRGLPDAWATAAEYWDEVRAEYDMDQIIVDLLTDPNYHIGNEPLPEDSVTIMDALRAVADGWISRNIVYEVDGRNYAAGRR